MQIHTRLYTLSLTLLLISTVVANGQSTSGTVTKKTIKTNILPLDPNVRKGKLANGFTYYIRRNTNPENRVVFYLANKVGSVLEDENQRGLAHFLEHMSFNGTKHYPKNELVDYLQRSGIRFGADLNAYTSFDETVYQLPLPADDKALVNNGIQIIRDWAQDALLDPEEINKERGVVLEEKRLGKGAQQRIREKTFPVLANHSRYAERMPIGTDTVLNNFKPETIRKFYHDWYRPDLQALIVVGDMDVNQMEQLIRAKFSDLKNPQNERTRINYAVRLTGANQFLVVTDPEMTATVAQVIIKHKALTLNTPSDYRQSIVQGLFNKMLSERYEELISRPEPPYIQGDAGISGLIKGIDAYNASVVAKPGELEKGFKALWRETERVKRYGFTQTELDRAKINYLSDVEAAYKERAKTSSESYVNEYLENFLTGTASPGKVAEYQLVQNYLPGINLAQVNNLAKEYITETNRDFIIKAPAKSKQYLPDEAQVKRWFKSVQNEKISAYIDDISDKPLLLDGLIMGKIVKETKLENINTTELVLSNGVKVVLKPTAFKDDQIIFTSYAPGGTSLYSDADYASAAYASSIIGAGGVSDFSLNQLQKALTGKQVNISPYIGERTEGITGSTTNKDLETELELVHLYFTRPRKDPEVFQSTISRLKADLVNGNDDPNSIFSDTVSAVIGNYHSRRTALSLSKLDEINLDKCFDIYKERFADASNFTFTFVGSFTVEQMKPLLAKYLGSLPSTYQPIEAKDLGILPPAGKISKTVFKGKEPKASVTLILTSNYDFNADNNKIVQALAAVLELRLLERLREEESGVYAPSCHASYNKFPTPRCGLSITFGCSPENAEKLIASAWDELIKLQTDGPDEVNVEKFKAENKRGMIALFKTNGFWLNYLNNQQMDKSDLEEVNEYEKMLNAVTKESIKAAANKYFNGENLMRFVLMPESSSPK